MISIVLGFSDLLAGALLSGAMFGVWLLFNPRRLSGTEYLQQHKQGVRTLDPALPILGAATIVLTMALAALGYDKGQRVAALLAAGGCFLAAGLITRFINQPINSIVMTWAPEALPADWNHYRLKWWRWHIVRTSAALIGLCLLICAHILPSTRPLI